MIKSLITRKSKFIYKSINDYNYLQHLCVLKFESPIKRHYVGVPTLSSSIRLLY